MFTVLKGQKAQMALNRPGLTPGSVVWYATEFFVYEVDLDPVKVRHMAVKAARNKSGKSTDGAMTVRVVSRKIAQARLTVDEL